MDLGLAYQQERNIGLLKRSEKPGINTSNKEMMKFARQFNDLKTANYLEDYEKRIGEKNNFGTSFALNYLNELFPEKVSVNSHSTWQDSIYDAAITHMQKKVCEILPSVYQEYLLKKNAGIILTPEKDRDEDSSINDWYKELIFIGRELKGEPRDFNY